MFVYFSGNLQKSVKSAHNTLLFEYFMGREYHLNDGTVTSSLQQRSMIVTTNQPLVGLEQYIHTWQL